VAFERADLLREVLASGDPRRRVAASNFVLRTDRRDRVGGSTTTRRSQPQRQRRCPAAWLVSSWADGTKFDPGHSRDDAPLIEHERLAPRVDNGRDRL
jgi:hypothetical protein